MGCDCSLFSQLAHEGFDGWPRSPRNPNMGSSAAAAPAVVDGDFAVISGWRSSAIVTLLLSSPSPPSPLRWITVSSFSLLLASEDDENEADDDRLVWGNASMAVSRFRLLLLAAGTVTVDRSVVSVPHWSGAASLVMVAAQCDRVLVFF